MIVIRPIDQVDPAVILDAINESRPELSQWLAWCTPEFGAAGVIQFQQKMATDSNNKVGYTFGVFDEHDYFCGMCGINAVNVNRYANLGYWTRTSRTGRGIATAAVRQVAEWVFKNSDLQRLELVAAVDNLASQRVAARAGALNEGVLRKRVLLPSGQADGVMYSLVRR